MSYEQLIGKAILGNDEDRKTSERRIGVKMAVSRAMFCQFGKCGKCLDQSTAALIGFWSRHIDRVHSSGTPDCGLVVTCQACLPKVKAIEIPLGDEIDIKIETWDATEWHQLKTS